MEFDEDGKLILKKIKYKNKLIKKPEGDPLEWFFKDAWVQMGKYKRYNYGDPYDQDEDD